MAVAKLLLPSLNLPSKLKLAREPPSLHNQPWGLKKERRRYPHVISSSFHEIASIAVHSPLFVLADAAVGYSNASYYTSLGLFVISVPGLWSLIKRSVKSKVVKKTFVEEQKEGGKKAPNHLAGEILSFFTRNNFLVFDKGETITFEGTMVPSEGQAALLTFCTCISLASVALVLTITVPDVGNNWFALTVFSPLAVLLEASIAKRADSDENAGGGRRDTVGDRGLRGRPAGRVDEEGVAAE
ncbi:hypothetical protein LXL04_008330 [Taraxacum kok-saghyz]